MSIKLIKPEITHKCFFFDYLKEWKEYNEEVIPFSLKGSDMEYDAWLDYTYKMEHRETCPGHLVPASTYFLLEDDNIILGAINIRHELNDYLFNYGGHIGYGVRPTERKKGYAALMLKMAIPELRNLGLNKVLITCNKNNIASARTIIKNGGVLENEVMEYDKIVQRYWLTIH